ncbi:hypothetical protein D477_001179 [Arthrobacter crystallopoietes BAB-32]|uniref:Gram-positive cocci surface proteins LPxTG domain-containing protein n=1 Tax=Arthrobacter crystallopoietes BAB-32 TaxID=1246476 RepID=N1VCL1_9MICC|nr:LPXTG cell wall anchor domain-containing protein [Arthrobacter crystallopoietes]EMY36038.1 hypothetical protein D477_001179 [Arthrobacter crystallopoietes BAB-32]
MKKTLTALAIAGSLTFLGAGAAQANTYPAPEVATVSDSTVAPGETFVFTAEGFIPGETVVVTITLTTEPTAAGVSGFGVGGGLAAGVTGVIAPATVVETLDGTADADGVFSTEIALSEPGTYVITAEGQESGVTASATVEVVSVAGAGGTGGTGGDATDGTGSSADEQAVADGDQLANTGLESSALLWGGAGVLALGAGATAVVVSRRKNA